MKWNCSSPIGVFDSGVGGLTVLREIIDLLPYESVIYLGDTARCPYGSKPLADVKRFAFEIMNFLTALGVKLVVVACNTATAAALKDLQNSFEVPTIGVVEPGARAAALSTKTRRVGIIGTVGTIKSQAYKKAVHSFDAGVRVFGQACPEFVDYVERGEVGGEKIEKLAQKYLVPFKKSGVDALILGCTHYPLLQELIQKVVGEDVKLISSARETAQEVRETLKRRDVLNDKGQPRYRFMTTGDPEEFLRLGKMFLGREINLVESVELEPLSFRG
jgi:glutamate racemase